MRRELEVPLQLAAVGVQSDNRGRIEVVAGPLVAHPRAAVAGAPVGEVGFWIVVARHPHRRAAGLPLIALRPRLAAGFAGLRNRVGAPELVAVFGIERRDVAAHAELAA